MAIYKGTWKDEYGVPFSPEGKILHQQNPGGTVCLDRHRLTNHPSIKKHREVMAYLQHRWFNVLNDDDRFWWSHYGSTWPRGSDLFRMMEYPGWNYFISAAYAEVWRFGSTTLKSPSWTTSLYYDYGISEVDHINQRIKIKVYYDSAWATTSHRMMVWYQMKPYKVKEPTCWRDTRMINMIVNWHPDGGYFKYWVPAQYRLVEGRTTRINVRQRGGCHYSREDQSYSYTIPYP